MYRCLKLTQDKNLKPLTNKRGKNLVARVVNNIINKMEIFSTTLLRFDKKSTILKIFDTKISEKIYWKLYVIIITITFHRLLSWERNRWSQLVNSKEVSIKWNEINPTMTILGMENIIHRFWNPDFTKSATQTEVFRLRTDKYKHNLDHYKKEFCRVLTQL